MKEQTRIVLSAQKLPAPPEEGTTSVKKLARSSYEACCHGHASTERQEVLMLLNTSACQQLTSKVYKTDIANQDQEIHIEQNLASQNAKDTTHIVETCSLQHAHAHECL